MRRSRRRRLRSDDVFDRLCTRTTLGVPVVLLAMLSGMVLSVLVLVRFCPDGKGIVGGRADEDALGDGGPSMGDDAGVGAALGSGIPCFS